MSHVEIDMDNLESDTETGANSYLNPSDADTALAAITPRINGGPIHDPGNNPSAPVTSSQAIVINVDGDVAINNRDGGFLRNRRLLIDLI